MAQLGIPSIDPTPAEEFLFFDHPGGRSRIMMAMTWKAEHLGQAGVPGGPPGAALPTVR